METNPAYPYPMEVYKDGVVRVTWSPEEHAVLKKQGWTDEAPEGVVHKQFSAVAPKKDAPKKVA